MSKKSSQKQLKISKIEVTADIISARGGLSLFLRYLEKTEALNLIEHYLRDIKSSKKGLSPREFIVQFILFLIDGSHSSITYFDQLKNDDSYAAILELERKQLASSHQIKRFFRHFINSKAGEKIFRIIISELFLWRLEIEKPKYIILGIDTMVLNNDDANKREGVEPTYKKKKGFQPLHITWGPYLVDVIFRKGSAHSNHGNDYIESVSRIVEMIRRRYAHNIPIIVVADSGFFDQKAFRFFERELKINYVVTGKLYEYLMDEIKEAPLESFSRYTHNGLWRYVEFGFQYKSWEKFRRAVFTSLVADENEQTQLDFMRLNSIIITNIGMDEELNQQLASSGIGHITDIEEIIRISHERGRDELVHRSLKELATREQLPFKHFEMNQAVYYLQVISHFMFESFKRDISKDVLPATSYPNTFRRILIDFAVKIVNHSGRVVMKVRQHILDSLKLEELWERCQSPPIITFC